MRWAFPVLIGYGAVTLATSDWPGRLGVAVALLVVFTGWTSFGLIAEKAYNDLLLLVDLGLLSCYFLLIFNATNLGSELGGADAALWIVSGAVFVLYAIWDLVALAGRDTQAQATAAQLKRFAVVTGLISVFFFIGSALVGVAAEKSPSNSLVVGVARGLLLAVWILIIGWWIFGKINAALEESQ